MCLVYYRSQHAAHIELRILVVLMDGCTHVPVVKERVAGRRREGRKYYWGCGETGEREDKMRCEFGERNGPYYIPANHDA